jgi:hypothetical protein
LVVEKEKRGRERRRKLSPAQSLSDEPSVEKKVLSFSSSP